MTTPLCCYNFVIAMLKVLSEVTDVAGIHNLVFAGK